MLKSESGEKYLTANQRSLNDGLSALAGEEGRGC